MKRPSNQVLGGLAALVLVLGAGYVTYATHQAPPAPAHAARKLYVTGVLSGVHVVDLATGKETAKIDTGVIPHNLEVSADGKYVYATNVGGQTVSVIDTATDKKVKDLLVGELPDIPAHHEALAKVSPGTAPSCKACHHDMAIGSMPNALTWAPDKKHLMINEMRQRAVTWLDPETGKSDATYRFDLPTPAAPANMAVDPKTGEIWVLHRWEAPEKHFPVPVKKPVTMADFSHDPPAGQHFSWVTIHDPEMKHELGRIKMDLAVPFDSAFSPDGKWFYVAYRSANKVAVFDRAERKLVKTFTTAVAPTGLALSQDGKELYVTCLFSDPTVVQILDAETGEVKVSMGVPPSPSLVVQDPATGYLYVTATGYNAVLEIDPKKQALLRELPSGHQPLDLVLVP